MPKKIFYGEMIRFEALSISPSFTSCSLLLDATNVFFLVATGVSNLPTSLLLLPIVNGDLHRSTTVVVCSFNVVDFF